MLCSYADADLTRYVVCEVVKGLHGLESNPFEYIVRLREMGVRPVGFRLVDGDEKFVVHFYINMGKILRKKVVGCYAHNDGEYYGCIGEKTVKT